MVIREATKRDLNNLINLYKEYDSYENHLDKSVSIDTNSVIRKRTTKFLKTKEVRIFVIEEDKEIFGLIDFGVKKSVKQKIGVIHNLIISKKARGRGYGSKLTDFALDYFKRVRCNKVGSFVRANNLKAQEFWKKKGFDIKVSGFNIEKKIN